MNVLNGLLSLALFALLVSLVLYLRDERLFLLRSLDSLVKELRLIAQKPGLSEVAVGVAVADALRPYFVCYYCSRTLPYEKLEQIGKYDYCLEHGSARQKKLNGESHV